MAIFVDVSDVDLDRRMVFGGDETVGGGTKVSENGEWNTICVGHTGRRLFLDPEQTH